VLTADRTGKFELSHETRVAGWVPCRDDLGTFVAKPQPDIHL
jgi:hypothetical protein